jgi:hypothetical protein
MTELSIVDLRTARMEEGRAHEIGIKLLRVRMKVRMSLIKLPALTAFASALK